MKLKHVEANIQQLCRIRDFKRKPNIELEQYSTPPRMAAELAMLIDQYDDIEDKLVGDFGCGCGLLSAAVLQFEPAHLLAVDIDTNCLDICAENLSECPVDYLNCNILESLPIKSHSLDTVVTNPPFGTRNQGADSGFLTQALAVAPVVYSFHKESTRRFFEEKARTLEIHAEVLGTVDFELPKLYKMHRKAKKYTRVDIWRFASV